MARRRYWFEYVLPTVASALLVLAVAVGSRGPLLRFAFGFYLLAIAADIAFRLGHARADADERRAQQCSRRGPS